MVFQQPPRAYDDQIVPIGAAVLQSAKLVKGATLKVYPGFPHGMPTTNADQINADFPAFFNKAGRQPRERSFPLK